MSKSDKPKFSRPEIVDRLRVLQRQRTVVIKSRIMQVNRLQAVVAGCIGYDTKMTEQDRMKKFKEASDVIALVDEGGMQDFVFCGIIQATMVGVKEFNRLQDAYEYDMVSLAKQLPIAKWVNDKPQTGFGIQSLAVVIGETGDLYNYENPAKVWKRMGCAPHGYNNKMLMGSTWRYGKEGKLPAEEWDKFGYCPRRRSIAYVIGEGLIKLNLKTDKEAGKVTWCGPYRARYDQAKRDAAKNHPEWTECTCKGTGKTGKGGKCGDCQGKGLKMKRAHMHGMLLATKLLLKELWVNWRK